MAKTSTAKLNVQLTASTGPFSKGIKTATANLRDMGKTAINVGGQVAKLGAGMGAVAVGGLAVLTKQGLAAIDAMAKLSARLDISTEALAGFQLAAELSGVSGEQLETAITRMSRTIGDAEMGLSGAQRAIEALGLSTDALSRMRTEDQFRALTEGLAGIESTGQRTAIAMQLFGRAGAGVVNIAQGGAGALADAASQAQSLGLAVSNIDARVVENANDAMTRAGKILTGLGQQLAVQLAPAIEIVATKIFEIGTTGDGVAGVVSRGIEMTIKAFGSLASVMQYPIVGFKTLELAASAAIGFIVDGVTRLLKGIRTVADLIGIDSSLLNDAITFGETFRDGMKDAVSDIRRDLSDLASRDFNREADRMIGAIERVRREARKRAEESLATTESANNREALSSLLPSIGATFRGVGSGLRQVGGDLVSAANEQLARTMQELREAVEEQTRVTNDVLDAGRNGVFVSQLGTSLNLIGRKLNTVVRT